MKAEFVLAENRFYTLFFFRRKEDSAGTSVALWAPSVPASYGQKYIEKGGRRVEAEQ